MAKDMTLWWGSGSPPCWRVMIALEEKKLQGYNQKLLSFEKGEHKSKEVMDVNPRGQLPAFKCGDKIINESYGACFFLECEYMSQGTKLIPVNSSEKALVLQRTFEGNTLHQKMADVFMYNRRVPENERQESAFKRLKETLTGEVQMWEGHLQKTPGGFLAGKSFSMADVIVYPSVALLFRMGLSEKRYPKLSEYHKNLKDRPSIKATWPPLWKDTPGQDFLKDI
ncbi:glutathione S-transferase A-like [Pundamilia nyererei]|uniref:Glutathione S-transferase A-like n=2 Tax=Haplochromini TaxID=319058 RepID=A0A3B4EQA8_9CICH|nr:PREDICTED: glutathione S-transferase A-like [Pundamilia nyererei]XP_005946656.1 glutathione S-transferase A [Haplochromis burtoni]